MRIIQQENVKPVCPFCKKELDEVSMRELRGVFGKRFIYFCSSCKSVLGVSHRKGFWMG